MNCSLFRRHVDAFLDAEVDPTTQIEFERHVAACAGCQEVLAFERATRRSTRAALAGPGAPDALRARIAERLQGAPEPLDASLSGSGEGRPWLRVYALPRRYAIPLSLAAAAALAVLAAGRGPGVGGEPVAAEAGALPLFEEVARLHSTPLPSDVRDPQDEQVLSYFRGKVEFPVRPAAFPNGHARLVGVRVSNVRERRAAALYYDVKGRRMTVVVYAEPRPGAAWQVFPAGRGLRVERVNGRPVAHRRVGGYTVSATYHDGLTYALTGDMDERTLVRLAATAQIR